MIHLCYSNRTEALLAALVENLRRERAERGPFAPVRLVVPNRNVETYVKHGVAEALGIAAQIEVTFLRKLLARVAERALPDARVVDARVLEGFLLVLLHDEAFLAGPLLAPVRDYLYAAGDKPDAVDRRRAQLAAELAQLFDEYAGSRPDMLAAWRERATLGGRAQLAEAEAWQRALWLAIFGADGLCARRSRSEGIAYLSLPDLVAAAERRGGLATAALAPSLHLFGVSYVARGYHRMLAAIAADLEVRVYTLNPCREFWEDLETAGEARRRLRRAGREALFPTRAEARQPGLALDDDPFGLTGDAENLPLRLWGRPGRENVRLLNQIAGGDFDGRFVSQREQGGARTLLARLQDDILDRAVPAGVNPELPALRADDSLAVLPCPGVRRELEVIAAEIWRLVRADPTLRLNQIALVVPEAKKDLYLSHVGAVFSEAHGLPASVVDLPLGGGHRLGEAIELLLALPFGAFSRRELMPLLTHPSILARFPEASAGQWLRLAEALGVVHGADHTDHGGTYVERDLLNWDQGIRRLVLGALMSEGGAGGEAPVSLGGQQYLPVERPADEQEGALALALLVRSLIEDARLAAGVSGPRLRPLGAWLDFVRGMLTGYLVPTSPDEEALLGRCLAVIDDLAELPLGDETPVSYRIAAELCGRALSGLGGARGQYLAHGVTVASFVPMRAIPFRVVFVAGLGQGDFPSAARGSELDSRRARRAPGDVTPREQDLYMFLETLLCARERLVLSYVARDELTGERLPPSSVVLELREILGQGYLAPGELARLIDEAPRPALRRYDDEARAEALPLARRERVAKALGRSLRDALPAGCALPDLPALARALDPETFAALGARLGVHAAPVRDPTRAPERGRRVVPLVAIRQFLEDPLQGSARFRLRMREVEGDEELADREDEAFETDRPTRAALLRDSMLRALLTTGAVIAGGDVASVSLSTAAAGERVGERPPLLLDHLLQTYNTLALHEELAARIPTGFLRAIERPEHGRVLGAWLYDLDRLAAGRPLGARLLCFGRASERQSAISQRLSPIVLDLGEGHGEVELVGLTDLLVAPEGALGSLQFLSRSQSSEDKGERRQRDRLRAFVDHLALAAAGIAEGPHEALRIWCTGEGHDLDRGRFRAVTAECARGYLAALVRDMLTGARDAGGQATGVHPYLLPCEAIFTAHKSGRDIVEVIEQMRDNYLEKSFLTFSSVTGPVPEAVERHDPPPAEEARRMAEARFGLFFALLEEQEAAPA